MQVFCSGFLPVESEKAARVLAAGETGHTRRSEREFLRSILAYESDCGLRTHTSFTNQCKKLPARESSNLLISPPQLVNQWIPQLIFGSGLQLYAPAPRGYMV